jgi:hypothetical protein
MFNGECAFDVFIISSLVYSLMTKNNEENFVDKNSIIAAQGTGDLLAVSIAIEALLETLVRKGALSATDLNTISERMTGITDEHLSGADMTDADNAPLRFLPVGVEIFRAGISEIVEQLEHDE